LKRIEEKEIEEEKKKHLKDFLILRLFQLISLKNLWQHHGLHNKMYKL